MTGLLSTCGLQFQDWTAAYRLFACNRINMSRVFDVVRNEAVAQLPAEVPFPVAALRVEVDFLSGWEELSRLLLDRIGRRENR